MSRQPSAGARGLTLAKTSEAEVFADLGFDDLFLAYPIAWVIWVATAIWVIYRVVRGFLLFNDRKPIPAM